MGKRILSVSYIEDTYQYMEIDKQAGGFFPQSPSPSTTVEALLSACRKADEIYINAGFPSALYEWETFPKVNKRYVPNLVNQNAKEKVGGAVAPLVQYKVLGDVSEGGVAKSHIAYIAVQREDLQPLWTTFGKFMKKVKYISPLPVALAATVVEAEKPTEKNFMIVWVGEKASVIAISSSDGMVKMARNVPQGLSKGAAPDSEEATYLSDGLGKEIFMTSSFFKQEFREAPPSTVYFLGNTSLEAVFREHPMPGAPQDVHYGLSQSPVKGMGEGPASEAVHLIGNLFLPQEFTFLTEEEVSERKSGATYGIALAALILIIIGAGFWAFQLFNLQQDKVAERDRMVTELGKLQKEVVTLRSDVEKLKPFAGWKTFYEDTFQNRPPWNMVMSEVAMLVPDNIVIEELSLIPAQRGQTGPSLLTAMNGKIRSDDWESGLADLRQFGAKLQGSSIFQVEDVNYKPEALQKASKVFEFSVVLKLKPRGTSDES